MQNIIELPEATHSVGAEHPRHTPPQTPGSQQDIPRRSTSGPAPLSFGQEQLWFLAQQLPTSAAYNESLCIRLSTALDVAAFAKSLNAFIKRHAIWRTSFPSVDGLPVQLINPSCQLPVPLVDLRALPFVQRAPEAVRLATAEAMRPFDLAQAPLLRVTLIRLADDEYRLYMSLHHIIVDAVSISQVFLPELQALYAAYARGQVAALPPVPLQYADFATWERNSQQKDILAEHLAFWKRHLSGAPPLLDLPADRPRPPVQSYRGSMLMFSLSGGLSASLQMLSSREGVTLRTTLTAAFQTLLHRYSGQDDLLLGSITSRRKRPEVQLMPGYFLNTSVLRADLAGDPTFIELLERTRDADMSTCLHEDVPLEAIVQALQPERSPSYQPLVQVLLSIQPQLPPLAAGWSITQMEIQTHTSKFDLTLELDDRPEGLIGRFIYNTDLFDESTIARMRTHWLKLLAGIVSNPALRLSELPLLSEAERQLLLFEWNSSTLQRGEDLCIHQLFEAQVARNPAALAVSGEFERPGALTYQELNRKANQLARHLQKLGVGPEVLVGICLERSLEMVIGILAILKAGGAYVPLDPEYPARRLAFLLEDSQAQLLLTHQRLLPLLPTRQVHTLCLDAVKAELAQEATQNLLGPATPDNLAYMIYTSGSTGKPKGVLVTHRNLLHSTAARTAYYEEPVERFLLLSSFAFDSSVAGIFWTLCTGGALILPRADQQLEVAYLAEVIAQNQVSHMLCLPALYTLLLEQAPLQQIKSLRTMIVAGEACPVGLVKQHFQLLPQARLYNEYGPTEGSVWCSVYNCRPEKLRSPVPIGRPLAGTRIYLLDTHLQPVPIGAAGELYVGGAGVARGYLKRPHLTAERFLPDPFSQEPGARLYKTGDLARYLPDGTIEFLGRIDQQVKIRGFRIEPGEIEAALRQLPAVREAVVVVQEDAAGDRRLVAYIVAPDGPRPSTRHVREALLKQLPAYMLPATFVYLDALPLTSNGKVDQRALPAPRSDEPTEGEGFVAPRLLVQHQLAQIWEDLLDKRPIGINDNFFHLGGHSLLAARLVARMEQTFGKKISLSTLFSGPTIKQLSEALHRSADTHSRAPVLAVQAMGSQRPFFFLHGDWTGGAFYCFALARALGREQPFYVLEPYTFAGLRTLPTLEAIAAAHLEALRGVQPEGPYLLGGFCNGGLVAYEMARQLRAAGQEVDLLLLVTPTAPYSAGALCDAIRRLGRCIRLGKDRQANAFLRARHALRHVYRFVRPSDSRLLDFSRLVEIDPRLNGMFPPVEALHKDYVGVITWLTGGYHPDIYAGKTTFFWAGAEPAIQDEWRPIVEAKNQAEIENHVVPGTHMSCITEHVQDVATELRTCLGRIQRAC